MSADLSAGSLIRGRRRPGGARVHVDDALLAPGSPLWETSLCLRNHAPTGPEWGYAGCGPAQLALAVLLLVTDSVEAERYYHLFKHSVVAGIRGDHWTLSVGEVRAWLEQVREGKRELIALGAAVGTDGALEVTLGRDRR